MTAPILAFYGDDFTGAADSMEVLQWAGLRTVLFLQPPTLEELQPFEGLRAYGVAGWSRTMSGEEMEQHLRPALQQLCNSGAEIVHYKTCSTFDSSPDIGSIGQALEIGREIFGPAVVPMLVGAPNLGRFQVFGNLFARSGLDSPPFRLDRHPTMTRHPITPMHEADVRLHLLAQTRLRVDLYSVLELQQSATDGETIASGDAAALLFDVLYPEHLAIIGQKLQAMANERPPRLMVGSSGVEYALTAHWTQSGEIHALRSRPSGRLGFPATDQLLVLTGSCSPVNERQVRHAVKNRFQEIPIATAYLADPAKCEAEIERVVKRATQALGAGTNVVLHSSLGPGDRRVAETQRVLSSRGWSDLDIKLRSGRTLGPRLGQIVRRILQQHPLQRVGVAGGDTSGYVAKELGITAIEAIAPVAPGSPLCRAYAEGPVDGVEFLFKGGQVGKDDVWDIMLDGTDGRAAD